MAAKSRLKSVEVSGLAGPFCGPTCQCLSEFYREELLEHHRCLERQREYYSDVAIAQAEDALQRLLANLDALCQRDDACQMIGELLRRIDVVTKLSAWTEPHQVH
jgi:hypothetical protein